MLYREWRSRLKLSMRQTHRAGEKLFVDYCGPTVPSLTWRLAKSREAQVFVAVLGASNYTYVEATWTQSRPDWIGSHVRAFSFFGGVPKLVIPDNLKSGVTRACRYEPLLNTSYAEMLAHYQTAAMPARPYKPRDKAKVEVGVQIVERWLLARLRHSQFEALDRPALLPLPSEPYEYAEWRRAHVNLDYHIEVDGHYYSVPHCLVKREIEVRLTATAVEVFHGSKRVAVHARSSLRGAHSTQPDHMPKAHRAHLEWTPGRFLNWAVEIGPSTRNLVRHLLETKAYPEQGYRSCLGLLSLSKNYGKERLELACHRALALNAPTRRSVLSILQRGLDQVPLPDQETTPTLRTHQNVRGAAYYQ